MKLSHAIAVSLFALVPLHLAVAADAPKYKLSHIPDQQRNVVCFARSDALALLADFHRRYVSAPILDPLPVLIELAPSQGYDCTTVDAAFIPTLPIQAVDLAVERGLDWSGRAEHFFVRAKLFGAVTPLPAGADEIYVFTSDFVILKD